MNKTLVVVCWLIIASVQPGDRATSAFAAELQINSNQRGSAFFAGREATCKFQLLLPRNQITTFAWRLSAEHRTLAVGEANLQLNAGVETEVIVKLPMPPLHDDVVQQVHFKAIAKDPAETSLGEFETDFTLFPLDPFSSRKDWLSRLNLQVYDPHGQTSQIFNEAHIPFQRLSSVSRLPAEPAVVIIGEGISLNEERRLSEQLLEFAAAGRKVLWFAPADGNASFPGVSGENLPKQLSFAKSNYIERLDKRLNTNGWSKDDGITIRPIPTGNHVSLLIDNVDETTEPDYRWMHVKYEREGQLVLSGLPIASGWDASPNPRYLLLKLLEL